MTEVEKRIAAFLAKCGNVIDNDEKMIIKRKTVVSEFEQALIDKLSETGWSASNNLFEE